MNVLIMTPYGLYRRWPTTPDTTKMVTNGAPVTMPQLAAMLLPEHKVRVFDGNAYKPPLRDFVELARWADVIGVNVMSSYAALNVELNLRFLREVAPGRPLVLGGHHATFYADEWLQRGADVVVRREGELTFRELIDAYARGGDATSVAGTSVVVDGQVRHNPDRPFVDDLDTLPLPAWHLVDFSGYDFFIRKRGKASCIETSRGCEHHCQFCQVSAMWNATHRWKSPGRVVQELRQLHDLGVRQLWIVDDNYGEAADLARQTAIYDAWGRTGLDVEWGTFMRVDYVLKNPEVIEQGARTGLCYAFVGFETVSSRWLKTYNKGFRETEDLLAGYREAYRILKKNGVMVYGFIVIGYPGQTWEEMEASLAAFPQFCDYPVVSFYKPLKGTAGYRHCEQNGLLAKDTFYHDSQATSIRGNEAFIPQYNRFFLKYLLSPQSLSRTLRASSPLERDMQRAIYRWFASGVANLNADNFGDWLQFKLRRGETSQQLIDRLTAKYLDPGHVQALARPFGRVPGGPAART